MNGFVSGRTAGLVAAAMAITWLGVMGLVGQPATGPWPTGLLALLALTAAHVWGRRVGRSLAPAAAGDRAPGSRSTAKTS